MAKKGTKIAVTYFITITITFLIIGGICYMLYKEILYPKDNGGNKPTPDTLIGTSEFVPTAADNKTTLFIFDSEKRMSGCCFMVVRMIAEEQRLAIMPIPADTKATVGSTSDSIYEFYRKSGAVQASEAVGNLIGTKIDYYVKLNNDSFSVLVDIFGGVDLDIPYNLIYTDPNTGAETIIREGTSYMDSQLLRQVFTFPNYNSGEEYRAKMVGVAVNDLINRNISESFANHIDEYFTAVINSTLETNFTKYDYEENSQAMKYVAKSDDRVSKLVTVTGAYDDEGLFVLDENFLKSLPERFKLDEGTDGSDIPD